MSNSVTTTQRKFSKSDLLDMASRVLDENAGWWNPSDDADKEEAKQDQLNLDDINKTKSLINAGKLEDPYGSIDNAYDDYHGYIADSEEDYDTKQRDFDELDALIRAIQ